MPRAACSVRAGEDGREGARVMLNVTAKLCDRNFGAKVQICFPRGEDYDVLAAELKRCLARHAERIESLLLSGELESIFSGHQGTSAEPHGGHDSRQEVKENALHRSAPVMLHEEAAMKRAEHETVRAAEPSFAPAVELEYVPFPREGTVTMKEIVAAWKISQATYYRHMDIYPKPLKFEGLSKNAPARFDAAAVRHAFECGHVERRRREVRLG